MDYGPPIRLRPGKGSVLKIKRGGTGKISNSGTEKKRVRPPVIALRDKNGKHLPKPERGAVIWDPRDPFIVEYRKEHPVVEAAWRTRRAHSVGLDIETINRAIVRGNHDRMLDA